MSVARCPMTKQTYLVPDRASQFHAKYLLVQIDGHSAHKYSNEH